MPAIVTGMALEAKARMDTPTRRDIETVPIGVVVGSMVVQPDKQFPVPHEFFLSDDDLKNVRAGKITLYFYGVIYYSDLLPGRRESGFGFQYTRSQSGTEGFTTFGGPGELMYYK
jgi:hypothetical protein